MKRTAPFMLEDEDEVMRIIRENPWATLVSPTSHGVFASHCPIILDDERSGVAVISHLGRPDDELHELGSHEVLLIVQGPNGYISPSWYPRPPRIPTWNHVTAHLYGWPGLLSDEENYRQLGRLVDRFEDRMPNPARLSESAEYAQQIYRNTAGFRLTVSRFDARLKLSQNKSPETVERIIASLEDNGAYANPPLAREMRRARPRLEG